MMIKSLVRLAAAAVLVGASSFAAGPSAPAAAEKPAAEAKAPAAKVMTFAGAVMSTDAIANTLVVKGGKGEETFAIAPTAKIMQGKKEVKIADVPKDGRVTVKYIEENGAKTATSIRLAAASRKPAKSAEAAAQ